MKLHIRNVFAKNGAPHWNKLSAHERLKYILNNQDIFLSAALVRPGELLAAKVTPESAQKYIIEREESPFFAVLDIKKPLNSQKEPKILKDIFALT